MTEKQIEQIILDSRFKIMTSEEKDYFGGVYGNCYLKKINEKNGGKYTALIIRLSKFNNLNENNFHVYTKYEGALRGYGDALLIFTGLIKNDIEFKQVFKLLNISL